MSKIVVTGGAGFIGSHVVRTLLREGHEVVVIDDLSSGNRQNLPNGGNLEFVQASILDQAALKLAVRGASTIIHLAAEPSVQKSIQSPSATHVVNYVGTMAVVEAARHAGVERIVYASSAAVYDSTAPLPLDESSRTAPISPYGVDKLSGEYLLGCMSSLYGITTVALRFFNVYGERQNPSSPYSGVISLFNDAIARGKQMKIFGDGLQTRDFIYAGDVARAVYLAATAPLKGHHVLNIATGRESTLLDLIEAIEVVHGKKADVLFEEARPGDIRRSVANPSQAETLLGFRAETLLQDGLTSMYADPDLEAVAA